MNTPAEAARLFLLALLMGAGLGVVYGFLRPLRPRLTALSDFLFAVALFWVWIFHSFYFCRGDIRMGNAVGILLGALIWDNTAGRLFRPVFRHFWALLGKVFGFFLRPVKFFIKKGAKTAKFLLATGQKMFTIRKNKGGADHGAQTQSIQTYSPGIPPQFSQAQDPGPGHFGSLHHRAAELKHRHHRDQGKHRGSAAGGRRSGAGKRRLSRRHS